MGHSALLLCGRVVKKPKSERLSLATHCVSAAAAAARCRRLRCSSVAYNIQHCHTAATSTHPQTNQSELLARTTFATHAALPIVGAAR